MENVNMEIIDHILSFDNYGDIQIILALNMAPEYIRRYSNIVREGENKNELELETLRQFLCDWRLKALLKAIDLDDCCLDLIDNLPQSIWEHFSTFHEFLSEMFIIKNISRMHLGRLRYFSRERNFGDAFHDAVPHFDKMCVCNECYVPLPIEDFQEVPIEDFQEEEKKWCHVCIPHLCMRCKRVEIPLVYDNGCCAGCAGCPEYNY
jgi:hypothetical protein